MEREIERTEKEQAVLQARATKAEGDRDDWKVSGPYGHGLREGLP